MLLSLPHQMRQREGEFWTGAALMIAWEAKAAIARETQCQMWGIRRAILGAERE